MESIESGRAGSGRQGFAGQYELMIVKVVHRRRLPSAKRADRVACHAPQPFPPAHGALMFDAQDFDVDQAH